MDGNTGRLFVSGFNQGDSEVIVLLDDNGDRIANAPYPSPYLVGSEGIPVVGDGVSFLRMHFVSEAPALELLCDVSGPQPRKAVLCAPETSGPQTTPTSLGAFLDPAPSTAENIYARKKDSSTIVVWLTDSLFGTLEVEGSIGSCAAMPGGAGQKLISRSSASRRSALDPSVAICTVVFTASAVQQVTIQQAFDSVDPNTVHAHTYELTASKANPNCQGNPSGVGQADTMANANGAGVVDWGLFGTPTSSTWWRGRIITNWISAPDAASCCGGNRVSMYSYASRATLLPNGGGICDQNQLAITPLEQSGGMFVETPTCKWDLGGGKPVDTFASPASGWTQAFRGTSQFCTAPFGFTFTTRQTNRVTRLSGGRSDGESAYQKIFIEVDCRL